MEFIFVCTSASITKHSMKSSIAGCDESFLPLYFWPYSAALFYILYIILYLFCSLFYRLIYSIWVWFLSCSCFSICCSSSLFHLFLYPTVELDGFTWALLSSLLVPQPRAAACARSLALESPPHRWQHRICTGTPQNGLEQNWHALNSVTNLI